MNEFLNVEKRMQGQGVLIKDKNGNSVQPVEESGEGQIVQGPNSENPTIDFE